MSLRTHLSRTQELLAISVSGSIVLGIVFAGIIWAAEQHFETIEHHQTSLDEAVAGFDKAISESDKREIKRQIRKLKYLKQKGTITDQELYELEGLIQELEDLS